MTVTSTLTITPLPRTGPFPLGATVTNCDLNTLNPVDTERLHTALYTHSFLIIKNAATCTPTAQYALTRSFDPLSTSYGHGTGPRAKSSILHPDLKTLPDVPQVQVIGNGFVPEYEGLKDIQLKHPDHATFHANPIPESEREDFTRFYRWHIDAALYALHPPRVTTLMCVRAPKGRSQTLRYDDGTGAEMRVPLGTTAFASGESMYELLSPELKRFVETTQVEYAPHPYIWMSRCRSRSDGLGLVSEGKELSDDELPPVDPEAIQILPMCWRNPVTRKLALQIHPSAVRKLHFADGTVVEDLAEVRRVVYRLMRPGIAPELVYCHDWEEGDMVLFNNRSLIHSVVGSFKKDEVRIFRQCNLAASNAPEGP